MPEESQSQDLADSLSDLFAKTVFVDAMERRDVAGLELCIVQMHYIESDASIMKTVRQTVIYLEDDNLDIPEFALWPHFKGVAGKLFASLGNMVDINFTESQQFSNEYHLFGWNEAAIRQLFSPEVRQRLSIEKGWSLRGKHGRLAVFQQAKTIYDGELEAFLVSAAQIMLTIQESGRQLENSPELRRDSNVDDLIATSKKMGGIQGQAIERAVKRLAVDRNAVEEFLRQPLPRSNVPQGLQRQIVGETKMVLMLGVALLCFGLLVPFLIFFALSGDDRWFAIPVGAVFLVAGTLTLALTIVLSGRKARILKEGSVVSGKITKVRPTNVEINGRRRYEVVFEVARNNKIDSVQSNIYAGIEKAQALERSGAPVRLLFDPVTKQVVCIELLLVTG